MVKLIKALQLCFYTKVQLVIEQLKVIGHYRPMEEL